MERPHLRKEMENVHRSSSLAPWLGKKLGEHLSTLEFDWLDLVQDVTVYTNVHTSNTPSLQRKELIKLRSESVCVCTHAPMCTYASVGWLGDESGGA